MSGEFGSEVERRAHALRLVNDEGMSLTEAAGEVGRTRQWLWKWKQRADAGGGLEDRSTAPLARPSETPPAIVELVLRYRRELEADPVASIGGLSIMSAMERDHLVEIPSVRTIERILTEAGVTSKPIPKRRSSSSRLPLPQVGSNPGVWQQADWIQDRYLTGGVRFNSLTITDVGSDAIGAGQHVRRTVLNAVTTLLEVAWPLMSISDAMSIDNAFAKTTHRDNPWTLWVLICLYFGVEVVVSPPGELGWTNHVEAANNLWQSRTIARHFCEDLDAVRAISTQACDWFNTQRPILDPNTCGTRYPAEHIANQRDSLRWPPQLSIADQLDAKGRLNIPLAAGRITFLRRAEAGTVSIAHTRWPTPGVPDGALVVGSITTADKTITFRHQGEELSRDRYPINRTVVDSYYPPKPDSIYHHA